MRLSFVQQLQDQKVKEGNTVRFVTELTHDNVPVVWYRNDVKLHVSRTVLIHVEGRKHTLEMRTLSLDDTCLIKAEAKGVFSAAKLTVVGKRRSASFSVSSCLLEPLSVPLRVRLSLSLPASFLCLHMDAAAFPGEASRWRCGCSLPV